MEAVLKQAGRVGNVSVGDIRNDGEKPWPGMTRSRPKSSLGAADG